MVSVLMLSAGKDESFRYGKKTEQKDKIKEGEKKYEYNTTTNRK